MESTKSILGKFFYCELSGGSDIKRFIQEQTSHQPERLKALKKEVHNYLNEQYFIDEVGIREQVDTDKPIHKGVLIKSKDITSEQSYMMVKEKRRLDGYRQLKQIISEIDIHFTDEKNVYKEMKQDLLSLYQKKEKTLWIEYKSGKRIADYLVQYLKEKYPTAESYPSESTIRKNWLKLTS